MAKKNVSLKLRTQHKIIRAASPLIQQIAQPPSLNGIKRALFIQPHPDDNQIAAGGTIAKLIDQGVEVYELTALDDRYTDLTYSGEGYTLRQKEALAAQKCLGMKNAGFLGFGDRTHASMREIADAIVPVIRRIRPDAIFTADPNLENECHEDHIKVAQAVRTAFLDASFPFLPEYVDGKKRGDVFMASMLAYYYTDKPNTVVDISAYEEKKIASMQCHASQMEPGLISAIKMLAQQFAADTDFEAVEVLRIISPRHAHCFNLPVGKLR